jgi:hypothetical protein
VLEEHGAPAWFELFTRDDAGSVLQEGEPAHWLTYWEVDDVDARASAVSSLGGSVLSHPTDTPFGRMATVADPAGARFKLRTATG